MNDSLLLISAKQREAEQGSFLVGTVCFQLPSYPTFSWITGFNAQSFHGFYSPASFFFLSYKHKSSLIVAAVVLLTAETVTTSFIFPEYFTDLEGRKEQDPSLHWDFYSSSLFGRNPSCP